MEIKVGVSNRHIHLTKESLEVLFGREYELTKKADLSQPGQFACNEVLIIKTNKAEIKNVRILGPVREANQIEISKTDSYTLGLNPPVRNSGDTKSSETVTLIGPNGSLETGGCIIANRHIHMTSTDALDFGFINDEVVSVKFENEKGGTLENVVIRVNDSYFLEMHIDTDDANANLIKQGDTGSIIKH